MAGLIIFEGKQYTLNTERYYKNPVTGSIEDHWANPVLEEAHLGYYNPEKKLICGPTYQNPTECKNKEYRFK